MQKLQTQGVHHITLVGADRQTSIDFWEGLLGMPFVFEQPNLDNAKESHIYFDPGDGRLVTGPGRAAGRGGQGVARGACEREGGRACRRTVTRAGARTSNHRKS